MDYWSNVVITFDVADTGGANASGVKRATALLCNADMSVCLPELVDEFSQRGLGLAAFSPAAELNANTPPGRYYIAAITVEDHAGNFKLYKSTGFGGDTPMQAYFADGPWVDVTP